MTIMLATFALVFLRGLQQQNVIGGHIKSAAITSYLIAAADVYVVLGIVSAGLDAVLWIGTGGALGVTTAMIAHRKFWRKNGTQSGG